MQLIQVAKGIAPPDRATRYLRYKAAADWSCSTYVSPPPISHGGEWLIICIFFVLSARYCRADFACLSSWYFISHFTFCIAQKCFSALAYFAWGRAIIRRIIWKRKIDIFLFIYLWLVFFGPILWLVFEYTIHPRYFAFCCHDLRFISLRKPLFWRKDSRDTIRCKEKKQKCTDISWINLLVS